MIARGRSRSMRLWCLHAGDGGQTSSFIWTRHYNFDRLQYSMLSWTKGKALHDTTRSAE